MLLYILPVTVKQENSRRPVNEEDGSSQIRGHFGLIRGKSSARPLVAVQRLPPDVSDSGFDFKKVSFLEFFDFSEIFTPKYFRGTSLPGILKEERQKCKDVYRVWGGQRRRTRTFKPSTWTLTTQPVTRISITV